ncbi:hypothetical protein QYM36_004229 [Artemia franciscana]|uniref:Uncharacterized protein n=1 Tax=Artemia franciscana TaxID=6661 RepID=A0AA88I4Z5_ARTSF|nr:hypothetical protein QYM36_004229 [Artemia franciscana]
MTDVETDKESCGASKHASIKKAMAFLDENPNCYLKTVASLGIEKEVRMGISELRTKILQANDSIGDLVKQNIAKEIDLITSRLGLQSVSVSDIVDVNILGKPSSSRIPPVAVGFKSPTVAREVLKNRSKLKGSQYFVSESLNRRRKEVLNAARDVVGMRKSWSVQGRIFTKFGDQAVRIYEMLSR